jgi:DNA (cytosine-5)-methyltransferase 1
MTQEYIHERDSKDDRYKVERIGRFKNGTQGYRIYSPNGLGVTLSSSGGGAGACTGLYKIGGKIRPLSAKECQKIVQFPNDFKRHRHDKTAVRQFGNSIPVFVISMILNQIERALMNIADRAKNGNKVNYKLQEQLTAV